MAIVIFIAYVLFILWVWGDMPKADSLTTIILLRFLDLFCTTSCFVVAKCLGVI